MGHFVIDIHGHVTTMPDTLPNWRTAQLAATDQEGSYLKKNGPPAISDDEIREIFDAKQVARMDKRGIDVTILSPRASHMGHHETASQAMNAEWARVCNDLVHRITMLYPKRFVGVCQLPQTPDGDLKASVAELERCVQELGFVGCNISPDPSGGKRSAPVLTDRFWDPLYEKMSELQVPGMIHVSGSCDPNYPATSDFYLGSDTTAFGQLMRMQDQHGRERQLFKNFPGLKLIIPHGGGAVPYHWGRYEGLIDMQRKQNQSGPDDQRKGEFKPSLDFLLQNVFFDTCVYHQPGIDLLTKVVPADNVLFASETFGAVHGLDRDGEYRDNTRRYVDQTGLGDEYLAKIFCRNALRVYPRLGLVLKDRGLDLG